MLIHGKCHCGNIRFTLTWAPDPTAIPARACDCSFCTKHGAAWTSDPEASLQVVVEDTAAVSHYAFGTGSSDFHVCMRCGVAPLVTCRVDGVLYAVVNVRTFDDVDPALLQQVSASFGNEDLEACLARRQSRWIGDVTIS